MLTCLGSLTVSLDGDIGYTDSLGLINKLTLY